MARSDRRFGAYDVMGLIGRGGMGEVYRAHDVNLGRSVALKFVAEAHALDEKRLARFEREAVVLASLNHPNIAVLYGVESDGDERALVMELIEGETLADVVSPGSRLSVSRAIDVARQVAQALDAAHSCGVVHRDLKPANIRIRPDGTVKVLDFGLAVMRGPKAAPEGPAAPTVTSSSFEVLGTAPYMSPEQVRGLDVDRRTDIWAFGCVLFEMLTGRRAFDGATLSDVIASVLEREPDWAQLPPDLPPGLERVLRRCLVKDHHRRLRDIGDAIADLDDADAITSAAHQSRGRRVRLVPAAVALVVMAVAAWAFWPNPASTSSPRTVPVTTLPGLELFPAFSPDGRQVVFTWDGGEGRPSGLYVQGVGAETPVRLTGGGRTDTSAVWSPDGAWIAFLREGTETDDLFVITPLGTSERRVASFSPARRMPNCRSCVAPLLAWSPDSRRIAVTGARSGEDRTIVVVTLDGSVRQSVLPAASPPGRYFESPAFSPAGDAIAAASCTRTSNSCIVSVLNLDEAGRLAGSPVDLTSVAGAVAGVAWEPESRSVIFGAASVWGNPLLLWRASTDGRRQPALMDVGSTGMHPAVTSPRRLAYVRRSFDVNIWRVVDGSESIAPISSSTLGDMDASYSPDGSRLAFVTDRGGEGSQVWTANADGTKPVALTRGGGHSYGSPRWSPDGLRLVFDGRGTDGMWHIWTIDASGGEDRYVGQGNLPSWSRDGRSIYFGSVRSGGQEVWRMDTGGGGVRQVTAGGGSAPVESPDGRTLYFLRGGGLYAMPVGGGPDRPVLESLEGWTYWPAAQGLFFVSRSAGGDSRRREVRVLDPATGRDRLFASFDLDYHWPGLSVSPDGLTVLVYGVETVSADVMLLDGYR